MKQRKHKFEFKKTIGIGYFYMKRDSDVRKKILTENCLDAIRERFKWLYELSDEELIKQLKQTDKRYRK